MIHNKYNRFKRFHQDVVTILKSKAYSSSNSNIPSEKMSLFSVSAPPLSCSGAAYASVPTPDVCVSPGGVSSSMGAIGNRRGSAESNSTKQESVLNKTAID